MKNIWFVLVFLVASSFMLEALSAEADAPMVVRESDMGFEDVMFNLKLAIEARGMLISGTLHVSDMLNRTGPDLGYEARFERAESVEFCSASLSHQMIQAAPENMAVCPFTISVYTMVDAPDQVYVAYRRQQLAGDAAEVTQKVHEMLQGIVTDAIEF